MSQPAERVARAVGRVLGSMLAVEEERRERARGREAVVSLVCRLLIGREGGRWGEMGKGKRCG